MKALRFSRLATATLRARKREYVGLAVGITLAVALVFALLTAATSQFKMLENQWRDRVGGQDAIVFDVAGLPDTALEGIAREAGTMTVIGRDAGADYTIGYYDEEAERLLNRRLISGRMPLQADEIALERGTLAQLRLPLELEQQVTLTLQPLQDGNPPEARRTFTLVGVLTEQSQGDPFGWNFYDHVHARPTGVTARQAPLPGSRAVVHRVLQLQPGVTEKQLNDRIAAAGYHGRVSMFVWQPFGAADRYSYVLFFAMLCLSLLFCAGIAILNVFQNRLRQREQQIGMLRAVGATRRQIALLYGQEAVLIALVTAPLGLLLGVGAAWLLLNATTRAPLVLLPGVVPVGLAVGLAVILLSAALPLQRAARLAPIRVIRDAELMLAGKRTRVKSQKRFKPAQLLSRRSVRLNRRGVTGVSVLVSLCMALLSFLVLFPFQFAGMAAPLQAERPAFSLASTRGWATSYGVSLVSRAAGLGVNDIAQLQSLPGVSRVVDSGASDALLVVENPTPYLTEVPDSSLFEARHGSSWMAQFTPEEREAYLSAIQTQNLRLQEALDTRGELMRVAVLVLNRETIMKLKPYVTLGTLNVDAVDRGEAWLAYAPDTYVLKNPEGYLSAAPVLTEGQAWEAHYENDYFRPGSTLDVRQVYLFEDEYGENLRELNLNSARHKGAQRPVGAVIDGELKPEVRALVPMYGAHCTLITTPSGIAAMNLLYGGPASVEVYTQGVPDRETEAWLFSQVEAVGLRAEGMTAHNSLASGREMAAQRTQVVVLFVGLLMVFFALCLGLVNNSLTGRLRAERRAIGSLRALGADGGLLGRVYARQLLYMLLRGMVPGALLAALITVWQGSQWYNAYPLWVYALAAGLQVLLVGLMFLFSFLHLNSRLRGLMKQPIISQIREMG